MDNLIGNKRNCLGEPKKWREYFLLFKTPFSLLFLNTSMFVVMKVGYRSYKFILVCFSPLLLYEERTFVPL